MGAREASAYFCWGPGPSKNELMLYSEYTNRSRPVRVILASEHAALCSIAGHIILLTLS